MKTVSNSKTTLGSQSNASYNNFEISAPAGAFGIPPAGQDSNHVNAIVNIYGGTYKATDNAVL